MHQRRTSKLTKVFKLPVYFFLQEFHTFPVTERHEIWHIHFSSWLQARELHPESMKNPNFWNQQCIWDPNPENPQNQQQNRQILSRMHSLTPKTHQESTILEFHTIPILCMPFQDHCNTTYKITHSQYQSITVNCKMHPLTFYE